jgi:TrmH family RNA methyltransferase
VTRPEGVPFTERTPRVVAARRLTRRAGRTAAGRFLAEGPQAVREALACTPDAVVEVFGSPAALDQHADLAAAALRHGVPVSPVTGRGMAGLSETVTPQGLAAVCRFIDVSTDLAVRPAPRLAVLLATVRDPGNAGTVLRTADAAGADTVLFCAGSVDPYNGKCVRASAGSLFHLPFVRAADVAGTVRALRDAGVAVLAAAVDGELDLDGLAASGELARPTAWVFGNEARGLPAELAGLADGRVRIPIYGRAESLNLAAAAAVCLYATAREQRADDTAREQRAARN